MRTLGVVGGGIVGKSLLFSLAIENRQKYDRVIIFESEAFAPSCTLRSTAIVAARGVLPGISPLGDLIHQGISEFRNHVKDYAPRGVYPITQINSALSKEDAFYRRYKEYFKADKVNHLHFTQELPLFVEEAHYVNAVEYCQWLFEKARERIDIVRINQFVTEIDQDLNVTTLDGEKFKFDHLILAGSIKNKLWSTLVEDSKLTQSKTVKGSFLSFSNIDWGKEGYSLSVDDFNLIYRASSQELLIGATSEQTEIYSTDELEPLISIYDFFSKIVDRKLPAVSSATLITGMREKSSKREPYLGHAGKVSYIGGLYKNGFTLSLKMAKSLVSQLP